LRREALSLLGRLEAPVSTETPEVALGRALYWDERVSLDGKTSCGSCHFARDWGADRRSFSPDGRGRRGQDRSGREAPLTDAKHAASAGISRPYIGSILPFTGRSGHYVTHKRSLSRLSRCLTPS
jgi:cytochrome c peroxidase